MSDDRTGQTYWDDVARQALEQMEHFIMRPIPAVAPTITFKVDGRPRPRPIYTHLRYGSMPVASLEDFNGKTH